MVVALWRIWKAVPRGSVFWTCQAGRSPIVLVLIVVRSRSLFAPGAALHAARMETPMTLSRAIVVSRECTQGFVAGFGDVVQSR
jgi:hypothetical protein